MYDLEFRNLTPEPAAENEGYETLQKICEFAPYGSHCQGTIERLEASFLVKFDVRSQVGVFTGSGNGSSISAAMKEAESEIHKQLADWRQKRFRDQMQDTYTSVA